MKTPNIFLIGPPGAGKTTVGRVLARELGLVFYDTDQVIEERAGVDIAWIYDVEGESGYARREETIIEELSEKAGILLATGAGAIYSANNRRHLSARGTVALLDVSIEAQLERMQKDKRRPIMQTDNKEEALLELMTKSQSLYHDTADICVQTDKATVKSVVLQILTAIREL